MVHHRVREGCICWNTQFIPVNKTIFLHFRKIKIRKKFIRVDLSKSSDITTADRDEIISARR